MSIFALVDCNNFFVSCERSINPSLNGKPVIVLSNNDGCIISRSDEVKHLDIPMGQPYFKIKHLLKRHNVHVFSSNFPLYTAKSRQVLRVFDDFSPLTEYYSIDEVFLSLNGTPPAQLEALGREIRDAVLQRTGIPVSVGIAQTKTLAKLANGIAKRSARTRGVLNLYRSQHLDLALSRTPVENVWGVGRRLAPALQGMGIYTALDLRDADDRQILRRFSVVTLRTVLELRGTLCHPISQGQPPRRSMTYSRSFGRLVETLHDMETAVAAFTARAAEKLREDGLAAKQLTVYFRTSRHMEDENRFLAEETASLPVATDCTNILIHEAVRLTRRIFRPGPRYYKAVVLLTELVPVAEVQRSLFETRDLDRLHVLMKTVDGINTSFGAGTLQYAAEGLAGNVWRSRRDMLSTVPAELIAEAKACPDPRRPRVGFVHPVQG